MLGKVFHEASPMEKRAAMRYKYQGFWVNQGISTSWYMTSVEANMAPCPKNPRKTTGPGPYEPASFPGIVSKKDGWQVPNS